MQNIIELIRDNPEIEKNDGVDVRLLMIEKTALKKDFFPIWTEDFDLLLKHYNGIYADGAEVWGIKPSVEFYSDIREENLALCPPEDLIILGYNEWDYLVFNAEENEYQLLDKNDLHLMETGNLAYVLRHFLKL